MPRCGCTYLWIISQMRRSRVSVCDLCGQKKPLPENGTVTVLIRFSWQTHFMLFGLALFWHQLKSIAAQKCSCDCWFRDRIYGRNTHVLAWYLALRKLHDGDLFRCLQKYRNLQAGANQPSKTCLPLNSAAVRTQKYPLQNNNKIVVEILTTQLWRVEAFFNSWNAWEHAGWQGAKQIQIRQHTIARLHVNRVTL